MSDNALWIILQRLRKPIIVIIVTYAISILGMVLIDGMDDQGNVYHLTFFDAFYFISYTASTIGFGETPYTFTYEQRLWVLICIYLTVIGWFYGIGALVSIISDKTLKSELMKSQFRKRVKMLKSDFIIILGYNHVHSQVIRKLVNVGLNVVLIDNSEENIHGFLLEDFSKSVPVMVGNALLTETLEDAGIHQTNCKAIVAHFFEEEKNLRIAILTKFLNPNVTMITKATWKDTINSLLDTDIAKVENPFEIFAKRIDIALTSPHILILENWIYKNADLADEASFLPQGKYIICGYGRLGKAIQEKFDKHGIEYVIIDEHLMGTREMIENKTFIRANADDKEILLQAGIERAVGLVAGTQNDIDNISILLTAKKLNPNIYVIARENTMKEVSIFEATKSDWLFIIERILINKTALQLAHPLKHAFLKKTLYQDEAWGRALVNFLKSQLGDNPKLMKLSIDEESAYALYHEIERGELVNIDVLLRSLEDWNNNHKAIALLLKRNGKEVLLPQNEVLQLNDEILFACDEESAEEIELIASNMYELHYVCSGKEKQNWLLGKLFRG
ncbi:NAD-binding protein [bacterium]|nr:NAD-binding protein [bacterium]MBU1958717.1 NAD-binding protein [bacterium]